MKISTMKDEQPNIWKYSITRESYSFPHKYELYLTLYVTISIKWLIMYAYVRSQGLQSFWQCYASKPKPLRGTLRPVHNLGDMTQWSATEESLGNIFIV